jgi:P27 family predicted phage terminase small subunit
MRHSVVPPELHLVRQGGKVRRGQAERGAAAPRGLAPLPAPPRRLSTAQRKIWREFSASVTPGWLTVADLPVFECFVLCVEQRRILEVQRQALGAPLLVETRFGPREHPLGPIQRKLDAEITRLALELGLSPLSRGKVHVQAPPDDDDPLSKFLRPKK